MAKITLGNLDNLTNDTTAVAQINQNNNAIEMAFETTLSRDGTSPNQMNANLDMNSYRILNLPAPVTGFEPLRLADLNTITTVTTFTQNGTGAIPILISAMYRDKILTPEQFGAITGSDCTAALNNCLARLAAIGGGVMHLGPGVYQTTTGVSINAHNVQIIGQGNSSIIRYSPPAGGNGIYFQIAGGAGTINGCALKNFQFLSDDYTHTKNGIILVDISNFTLENIYLRGWDGGFFRGGAGSVGVRIAGRESSRFHGLTSGAEYPLYIDNNPDFPTISLDSFSFGALQLFSSGHPCVTVASGAALYNVDFHGPNNWIGTGTKFQWIDTTSTVYSSGLTINGVKAEQSATTAGYAVRIEHNTGLYGFKFTNSLGGDTNGLYLRKVIYGEADGFDFRVPVTVGLEGLNIDASCVSFKMKNMNWHSSIVGTISGLTLKQATPSPSGSVLPLHARYSTSAAAEQFDAVAVTNNVSATTFNNVGITPPASTSNIAIGSGVTATFPSTDTYVGRATTDTLTNKTIAGVNNTLNVRIGADVSGLGTGVPAALGIAIGSAGAPVTFNGAGGTPSSIVLTNATGTASGLTAGNATTAAAATTTAVTDDTTTNATMFPLWVTAATGNLPHKVSSTKINFNPFSGTLTAIFFGGACATATVDTNTTQLANTAFVVGQAASATPLINGAATVGTSLRFARGDHVHPTDTTKIATVKKQIFTANGTYTPSSGMLYCIVEAVAGGGGGGGVAGTVSQIYSASGGGAGSYARSILTAATVGASKAVVIGGGGAGGTAGANNGSAGTDTTLGGTTVVAKGGSGGLGASSGSAIATGGAGGITGTGDLTVPGGVGMGGIYCTTNTIFMLFNKGGDSLLGPGAAAPTASSGNAVAGVAATANTGGGGSGATSNAGSNAAGGNGGSGVMFITEFCSQ